MNKPHHRYEHVYALVRIDLFQQSDDHRFTVTKVFLSEDRAEHEAERLNTLNSNKGARYSVQLTRLIPDGR